MKQAPIDKLIRQWTRAGVGFNAKPAHRSPDLEQMVLETARLASAMSRLWIMSATWLICYGNIVARHRLQHLANEQLTTAQRAVLGLLLDFVRHETGTHHFNSTIALCQPAVKPRPLFEIDNSAPGLRRIAKHNASALSKHWRLWAPPLSPKFDALRPASWVICHNPGYQTRADLKGDLRCSILATLKADPNAGASVLQLSKHCSATMAATLDALNALEVSSRITRLHPQRGRRPVGANHAVRVFG